MAGVEDGSPLAAAEALVAEDRFLDAIDLLSAANREHPDGAREVELVRLRLAAFAEVERHPGREQWPPEHPDPFPHVDGLISLPAGELTSNVLGGAIRHHGHIVVRGLFPADTVDRLVAAVDRALHAQKAHHDGTPTSETSPWHAPLDANARATRRLPVDLRRVCLADSPRAMFAVTEALRVAGVDRMVGDYLGGRPVMTEKKALLWRMDRTADVFSFHQEASVFGSSALRTLNVWVALSTAGLEAPGLQFYPCRTSHVLAPEPTEFSHFNLSKESVEAATHGVEIAAPVLEPGDAVIFDELLLHRTKSDPSMTKSRYSLEAWLFAPTGRPARAGATPLVL